MFAARRRPHRLIATRWRAAVFTSASKGGLAHLAEVDFADARKDPNTSRCNTSSGETWGKRVVQLSNSIETRANTESNRCVGRQRVVPGSIKLRGPGYRALEALGGA